jgi:hypothetical protein
MSSSKVMELNASSLALCHFSTCNFWEFIQVNKCCGRPYSSGLRVKLTLILLAGNGVAAPIFILQFVLV